MKHGIAVVCTPGVAPGFLLAGLPVRSAQTAQDAVAALIDQSESEPSVVFVQDDLFDELPGDIRQRLMAGTTPVLVPFPGPATLGVVSPMDYVVELLRRAIGYRVQIR